jgi:hypothetical protein
VHLLIARNAEKFSKRVKSRTTTEINSELMGSPHGQTEHQKSKYAK